MQGLGSSFVWLNGEGAKVRNQPSKISFFFLVGFALSKFNTGGMLPSTHKCARSANHPLQQHQSYFCPIFPTFFFVSFFFCSFFLVIVSLVPSSVF